MNGYLLDTNVVSELTRKSPDRRVVAFLSEQEHLWLSPVVLHELEFGLQRLPQGRRRKNLESTLSRLVDTYQGRILTLARKEAEWSARLRAQAFRLGKTLHLGDALIAGTARAHDLSIATRNTSDFGGLGVDVTNPWNS